MEHATAREQLVDLAVGSLKPSQASKVQSHVDGCHVCAEEVAALTRIIAALDAEASGARTSTPHMDDAIVAAMLAAAPATMNADTSTKAARRGLSIRLVAWFRTRTHVPRIAVALPTIALVVACAGLAVSLRSAEQRSDNLQVRLDKLEGRPQLDVLNGASIETFKTDAPFQDARVQVAVTDDGGVISLRNVPAPPKGRAWQVWQVDSDDTITSIGIIDRERDLAFLPLDDIDADDLKRIIITDEPAQGSDTPSSDEVARSTV